MDKAKLDNTTSLQDFKDFYWLKEELVAFCRTNGISTSGGKQELAERIKFFLETGQKKSELKSKTKTNSKFDWSTEHLSTETILTDNYKNSENVRAFFLNTIGNHFHFNVEFMRWTKQNPGKTLGDAAKEWIRLHEQKKDKNFKTEIAPQFEYNRYMRAFLNDNPDKSSKEAMKYWNAKRLTRGSKAYSRNDLQLLKEENKLEQSCKSKSIL